MRYKKVKNTSRSKCNVCGKVRYQDFMIKIIPFNKVVNGDVWICKPKNKYFEEGSFVLVGCAKDFLHSQQSMIDKMYNIFEQNKLSLYK